MVSKTIHGIIPIAATPFTEHGLLDEDSFQHMVRHLLGTGIQGLTLFGLATEFYKLTEPEKELMMRLLLEETGKNPSVASMISITDHSLEIAVRKAREAEALGADTLMLLPPFFLQPVKQAIMEHIRQVAAAVSIPVIVQYAPNQTGVRIEPSTFLQLKEEYDNIAFIKVETQPPGRYVSQLLEGSAGRLGALVGYAGVQMTDVLERGAAGIQPGCSFVELYVELYRCYSENDKPRFHRLFEEMLPYTSYWMQNVELIIKAEKVILKRRGIIASDYCRTPQYRMDMIEDGMIDRFLEQFQSFL